MGMCTGVTKTKEYVFSAQFVCIKKYLVCSCMADLAASLA